MADDDYILIGKIRGTHGLDGKLKVESYSESLDLFEPGIQLQVRRSEMSGEFYTIKSAKPYKRGMMLRLDEIQDITTAEQLVGSDVYILKDCLPAAENGEYYWFDIIGLSVFSVEGLYLGVVTSIFPTGSSDVYVVENKGDEILIPVLKSVILEIDLAARTMKVDLPEGL